MVLEKSESLRASGAGITIQTNGWRALDELGVASNLRLTALPLQLYACPFPFLSFSSPQLGFQFQG